MSQRIKLKNLRLIYLVKITIFSAWLVSFISQANLGYKFEYELSHLIAAFSYLSLVILLVEDAMIVLFTRYSKDKLVVRTLSKLGFYCSLIVFFSSEILLTLSFYKFNNFIFSVFLIILVLVFAQFRLLKSFSAAKPRKVRVKMKRARQKQIMPRLHSV